MAGRLRGGLRIIDANLNRAREAARVAEEHARFVLDDAVLTTRLKALRHALRELADAANARSGRLLAARDTPGDVGTSLSVPTETRRATPADVLAAALKRLQEALRVIEEHAKIECPAAAPRAEALRYEAYAIEAEMLGPRARLAGARLCVIVTEALCRGRDAAEVARAAVLGGAEIIQLREKAMESSKFFAAAKRLRAVTAELGALFIVNDRADIAAAADADGVHVGQADLPAAEAHRLLGAASIVGVSTHSMDEARRALADGADHIGAGTVFATQTKPAERLAGLDYIRACAAEVGVPFFAIGGITADNLPSVIRAGASRVAVCSAVIGADDVRAAAQSFRRLLPPSSDEDSR